MSSLLRRRYRDWGMRINRLYHRRFLLQSYNESGIDVFSSDWDSLVILDACRFDLFEERNTLPGRVEARESRASSTVEFLEANVAEKSLKDIVYVTATPQFHRFKHQLRAEFHDVIEVYRDEENLWKGRTPLPETTTTAALRAFHRYPNKRLLVHYTQPHHPFIEHEGDLPTDGTMWKALRERSLKVCGTNKGLWNEIWEAYAENLEIALPHIKEFMEHVDGRTVVTSDHGNMLGERGFPVPMRIWGHPPGIYCEELVKVPWLVYDSGDRRTITADPPKKETDSVDGSVVEERLNDLGYM